MFSIVSSVCGVASFALRLSNSQHPLSSLPCPHDLSAVPALVATAAAAAAETCTSGESCTTRRSTWPTSPLALALAKQQWGAMRREFDTFLGGARLARFEDLVSYGRRARTLERLVAFLDRREASRAPAALMYTFSLADRHAAGQPRRRPRRDGGDDADHGPQRHVPRLHGLACRAREPLRRVRRDGSTIRSPRPRSPRALLAAARRCSVSERVRPGQFRLMEVTSLQLFVARRCGRPRLGQRLRSCVVRRSARSRRRGGARARAARVRGGRPRSRKASRN